jgi:hypothetical protein
MRIVTSQCGTSQKESGTTQSLDGKQRFDQISKLFQKDLGLLSRSRTQSGFCVSVSPCAALVNASVIGLEKTLFTCSHFLPKVLQ